MQERKGKERKGKERILVADGFTVEYLRNIIRLERECFPAVWQYPEAEEYYALMLKGSENVHVFLGEHGEAVGYVLAKPFNSVVRELKDYDPELQEEDGKFYIETIQILPAYQGRGGARMLLIGACEEVWKRGLNKFAIHARTSNGLHDKIKRMFGGSIILSRNIERWKWAQGEPYEYIEWTYTPQ